MIALALSGGGARAIAFHLGCLRALHDRGVLDQVSVVSAVSGGSIIAALYAYWDDSFDDFERRVTTLLRSGLQDKILRQCLSPGLLSIIAATNLISRPAGVAASLLGYQAPLRRWASRSDGLEKALESIFLKRTLRDVLRPKLDIVLNACELRTGTAFRFGNCRSGMWRFGEVKDNQITVAHAIACSAAYPLLLPAFDRNYDFNKDGVTKRQRVIVADGGVYDNLGISCIEPGRDRRYSLHCYEPEYIVCCYAGYGQLSGREIPFGMYSRVRAAFEANFRKTQDASLNRLHMYKHAGIIKGFVLPYLGQQDNALPYRLPDLVSREEVSGYPTNFRAMDEKDILVLGRRGEQLTHLLLSIYCPRM